MSESCYDSFIYFKGHYRKYKSIISQFMWCINNVTKQLCIKVFYTLAVAFIHLFIYSLHFFIILLLFCLSEVGRAGAFPSMHWAKGRETTRHRSPVHHSANTQCCTLCEKKSERGSLLTFCVFSWVWSHKPGINAQHGTSILPAVHRARGSLSQPPPFTVPCPRSVSSRHSQKDSVSPPPVTLPLSHALLKLLVAGA